MARVARNGTETNTSGGSTNVIAVTTGLPWSWQQDIEQWFAPKPS
jgi:hypothetical protein